MADVKKIKIDGKLMTKDEVNEKYGTKYKRLTVVLPEFQDQYLTKLSKDLKVSKNSIMATIIDRALSDIYGALEYGHPEQNSVLMALEYMKNSGYQDKEIV